MSAYLINYLRMRDGIPDQEGLAQVKRTVEARGGRWHSHREEQGLEGARGNSVVLVEFGNMTEAENWYNSYEYKMAGFAQGSGSRTPHPASRFSPGSRVT